MHAIAEEASIASMSMNGKNATLALDSAESKEKLIFISITDLETPESVAAEVASRGIIDSLGRQSVAWSVGDENTPTAAELAEEQRLMENEEKEKAAKRLASHKLSLITSHHFLSPLSFMHALRRP